MQIAIMGTDVSHLLTSCTWSGDRTQAARKLEFEVVQDTRDQLVPVIEVDVGYTVLGADDDGELVFQGNIYKIEKDRAKSSVKCIAYDNCFILNKSKTTKKFKDAMPEEIASQICAEMGIAAGELATTGVKVSFIANAKTGYQIIMEAYWEAHKQNEKNYQLIMDADKLNVIEKGELCDVELDSSENMLESIYRESIENLVNSVRVVDEAGNGGEIISDDESISKYSMIQAVLREDKEKDSQTEAQGLFKEPEREGVVTALGDYRAKAGYSLTISDTLFKGQFWIKSDTHTFKDGLHEMKLVLEFENIMEEQNPQHEKPEKEKTTKKTKSGRKRKEKSESEETT